MAARKKVALSFGERLRALREKRKWTLETLAERVNLKPSYLSQLEQDKTLPSVAEILTIARTLSVEPSSFMAGAGGRPAVEERRDAREKRTRDYAYQLLSSEAPDRHLMAFLVTVDPKSAHRGVGYRHEGEEFLYVLSGQLAITVGHQTTRLKAGGSIHFDSGRPHRLRNPGAEPARLLAVIYHP